MDENKLYQILCDYDLEQSVNTQKYLSSGNKAYIDSMNLNRRNLLERIIKLVKE